MAQGNELEATVLRQSLIKVQNEVSGNAKNLPDALSVQLVEEHLMQFH